MSVLQGKIQAPPSNCSPPFGYGGRRINCSLQLIFSITTSSWLICGFAHVSICNHFDHSAKPLGFEEEKGLPRLVQPVSPSPLPEEPPPPHPLIRRQVHLRLMTTYRLEYAVTSPPLRIKRSLRVMRSWSRLFLHLNVLASGLSSFFQVAGLF